MANSSTSKSSVRRAAVEISLDAYEKGLARQNGLKVVATSIFVVSLFFLIPLDILTPTDPLEAFISGICPVFAFFWFWALSRMLRVAIAVFSLLFGLAAIVLPFLIATSDFSIAAIQTAIANNSRLWGISGVLFYVAVINGLLLSIIAQEQRQLLVTAEPGIAGVGQIFEGALGIHPICAWLPHSWQRLLARLLFVITAIARGLTISLLVLIWLYWAGSEVPGYEKIGFPIIEISLVLVVCGSIGAVITGVLRYVARRFARLSVENLMNVDARPPVLFLRSFQDDQIRLARKRSGMFQYRSFAEYGEPSPTLDHVVLDEATPLGPVVAIGVPGAPPPFGVARTYVTDDEWQNAVSGFARDARAIVIALDETAGVKWELAHIDTSEYSSKTLYLLPPRLTSQPASSVFLRRKVFSTDNISESAEKDSHRQLANFCVGWFQTPDGKVLVLTSKMPIAADYVLALRFFVACQTRGYAPRGNPLRFAPSPTSRPGSPELHLKMLLERNVETLFETKRGVVVALNDARVLAPVDGEYVLFDSLIEYRNSSNDQEPWSEIRDATIIGNFLRSLGAAA
jgi:hypothetical protein